MRPLIIIHGWSDHASSFFPFVKYLRKSLGRDVHTISLGDYISMDDEVTFDDLVTALMHAWKKQQLPIKPYANDVIVHSTGGLIIRHFLVKYFKPDTAPIKHLVMLAPANFGSALAHKGRAFFGRVLEGFHRGKLFQVGSQLLKGLELGSPYSWDLAMQDRFASDSFYEPGKILCTVLIGNHGLGGIAAAGNEAQSDGVVRIASANLQCARMQVAFNDSVDYEVTSANGLIAFGVLEEENHRTIVAKEHGPNNPDTMKYIVDALMVSDDDFSKWCSQLASSNPQNGFQQVIYRVKDQYQHPVKDYFVEFYQPEHDQHGFDRFFHEDVIKRVHNYGDDHSYRNIYLDNGELHQYLSQTMHAVHMSLTAYPDISQRDNVVGYHTHGDKSKIAVQFDKQQLSNIFKANTSLMIEIVLRREHASRLFQFEES